MRVKRLLILLVLLCVFQNLFATTIVVFSETGWCDIYLDDVRVAGMKNGHKVEIKDIIPGPYFIKITSHTNKLWHKQIIHIPDVQKIIINVEPDLFEIHGLPRWGNEENEPDTDTCISMDIDTFSLKEAGLLQVTCGFKKIRLRINGTMITAGNPCMLYLKAGEYAIVLEYGTDKIVDKTVIIKPGRVTWLSMNPEKE
jgi:hypothetical protein